ncbi:hypothetical protein NF27_DY00010 [Candidatus Jidaibacter acanthamoeba]|uniref:Uncharacterized protein n=1 Tax=Candidatus Jidaibacter acanthamoebae TaxID=86105 RepID=A0A0C1QYZ2_9RICK|nr:hypothetical protein [Candidatus Jidaibacter acanthamoeba]KIE04224.1 hypothetical protein NF27_IT00010 [Candidatus Jidaibacter acanthamoeba]KIE05220.1 hypothetical protein NF27_DY00010 [Candidatus Jidaibacter acanthamoeba]
MKEVQSGTIGIAKAGEGTYFLFTQHLVQDTALTIHDPIKKITALVRSIDIKQLHDIISTSFPDYAERQSKADRLRVGFLGGDSSEKSKKHIKIYMNFIKEISQNKELIIFSGAKINSKWNYSGFFLDVETGEVSKMLEKEIKNEEQQQNNIPLHLEKKDEGPQEKKRQDIISLSNKEASQAADGNKRFTLNQWLKKRESPYPEETVLSRIMPKLKSKRLKLNTEDEEKLTKNGFVDQIKVKVYFPFTHVS